MKDKINYQYISSRNKIIIMSLIGQQQLQIIGGIGGVIQTPDCQITSTPSDSKHQQPCSNEANIRKDLQQESPLVMMQSPNQDAREYNTAMSKSITIANEDNQKVSLINSRPKQEAKKYVSMPLNQKQFTTQTGGLAQFQMPTDDSKDGDSMLVDESLDFQQNGTKLQEILAQVAVNSHATPQPVSNIFIEGITSNDPYKVEIRQSQTNVVNHKTSSLTINGSVENQQKQISVRNKQQSLIKAGIYVPNNHGVVVAPEKTERKHIQHLLQGLQQTYLGIPQKPSPQVHSHHLNASTTQNWNGSSTITLHSNSNRKEVNKTNTIPLDQQPPIFADSLFSTQLSQLEESNRNQRYEKAPQSKIEANEKISPKLAQVPEIILKSPSLIGAGQTKRPAKIQINKAKFQSLPSNNGTLSPISVQSSHLTQASLIHQAQDEKMRQAFQIYRKPAIDHNRIGTRGQLLNGGGNNIAFENIEKSKIGSFKNNALKGGSPPGQSLSKASKPDWVVFPSKPAPSSGNHSFGPQTLRTLNGDQRTGGQRNGNITFKSAQQAMMSPMQQDQQYKIDSHSLPWMRVVTNQNDNNRKLVAIKTRDTAITGNTSRLRAQPLRAPSSIPPIQSQNQSPQPQKRHHAITTGEYQKAFNNSTSKRQHHKLSQLLKIPTSPTSNESPESLIRLPLNNIQKSDNQQAQRKSKLLPNHYQSKAKQSSHERNTAMRVSLTAERQEGVQNHLFKRIDWNSSLSPSDVQSTESLPATRDKLHKNVLNTQRRYQNSRQENNISIQQNVNNAIQQQNKATFVVSPLRASMKSDTSQNQAKNANLAASLQQQSLQSSTSSQGEDENWPPVTISQQDLTPWEGAEQSFEHNSKRPEKLKEASRSNIPSLNGAFSQTKNNTSMHAKGCLTTVSISPHHAYNQGGTPNQGIKFNQDHAQQAMNNYIQNKKQVPLQAPLLPKISQLPQLQNSSHNNFQGSGSATGVVPQPFTSQQLSGSFDIPSQLSTQLRQQHQRSGFGSPPQYNQGIGSGFYSPPHVAIGGQGGALSTMPTTNSQQYMDQTQTLNKILEFNKHMEWQMEVMKRKINGLSKRLKQNTNDQINGSFKSKSVKFQLPLQRVTTQEVSADMEEDSQDFVFGTFSVQSATQGTGAVYNN